MISAVKKPSKPPTKPPAFDVDRFLATIGKGRRILSLPRNHVVFAQGSSCDAVFYIQKGRVKLTVVSKRGKEATIAILNAGDFFGEGCLTHQVLRMSSATTMSESSILEIENTAMKQVLHQERGFSDRFVAYLLTRNARYESDLVDHLFNSSEKRLARILLLLAQYGKDGRKDQVIPKLTQETLAEMVGTTRARVSFFLNRFRRLGFIDYNGEMEVHSSLLNVVLHD